MTSAVLVILTPDPGRNDIAQGESKVAMLVATNGRSDDWALADRSAPHAANISNTAH